MRKLSSYRPLHDGITFVLACVGILVVVHLWIQTGRGFDRGCLGFSDPATLTASFDCEAVLGSDAGRLLGVSNIVWGTLFYAVIAVLSFAVATVRAPRVKRLKQFRSLMLAGGFAYSLYLVYYQYFVLGEFCVLCLMSASVMLLLFLTMVADFWTDDSKPTRKDTQAEPAMKNTTRFATLFVLTLLLAGADFLYFNGLEEARSEPVAAAATDEAPHADPSAECRYDPEKASVENYLDLINFSDPAKGSTSADVVVIEFFDPNCPHCRTMHPIMDRVAKEKGEVARFVYRPFLLGQKSLAQVEALHIANNEGKFFEMLEAQFNRFNARGLSMDDLVAIAGEIGMDANLMRTRIERGLYRSVVMRQRQSAIEAGVRSVPTVMINGKFVHRESRSVACLGELIDEAAGA